MWLDLTLDNQVCQVFLGPLLSGLDVMEFEQWANGFYFQYKFWLVGLSLVRYTVKIIRPIIERLKQN